MSDAGSRPAASNTRFAITSVPDLGEPVETRLPFMSATDSMPVSDRTRTWV